MTYQETVNYLFNVTPVFEHVGASAYKEGLDNTIILDNHYRHPHLQFKTIHIAGTNGKGSCSHAIASILQEAGYKVGLYTSPHLIDFRERIRINGLCISEEYVIDFVEDFIQWNHQPSGDYNSLQQPSSQRIYPSFFELTTALAFKYFADEKVDIAVIEVGLGGRLDCTNIITPLLSVITNISFDHTGFLGNTLAQIASEKAGIIKHQVPVVIGETNSETKAVFEKKAKEEEAPIVFAEEHPSDFEGEFELKGTYQKKNKQTILCAIDTLIRHYSLPILPSHISQGLAHISKNTGLMGRWQKLQESPTVICDTGHNAGGWTYLGPQIASQPCRNMLIVFGMVDDKDIDTVMEMLPKHATFYWTQAQSKRAIPAKKVSEKGKQHGLHGTAYSTVEAAYRQALSDAGKEDFIFVGGSSYIVADLLTYLQSSACG